MARCETLPEEQLVFSRSPTGVVQFLERPLESCNVAELPPVGELTTRVRVRRALITSDSDADIPDDPNSESKFQRE